jgi:hypothetical protein
MAKRSRRGKLNLRDLAHGIVTAIVTAIVGGIVSKETGGNIDLQTMGGYALAGGSAYLLKQFGTNSKGGFGKDDTQPPSPYSINKAIVFLLFSSLLLFSCTATKKAQVSSEISKYTQQALDITKKIQDVANDPRLEAATVFTPADWDNKTITQVRGYISSALPYIAIAQNCKDAELELLLKCIAVELQGLPSEQQRIVISKIVILLALAQQAGNVK